MSNAIWPDISEWYEGGATFAQEVQAGLAQGKTFEEMNAFPPQQAAHLRDSSSSADLRSWYDGYVSRWD